ncbi:TetR/AcrR family transcriptional regulator [Paenibacillus sp. FSL H8-0537]|uniref:TetR/AcrR family transcriptional regulator n=1 Tax=Paenibacillus sp. FSL H8-0537 TaxID=2921399 RepID=UPI00310108F5
MEQSQLSKGAIFHYVNSRDEIFAWVLQDRLESINEHFNAEVAKTTGKSFEGPMHIISKNLSGLEDSDEVTNKVLLYLLGREDEPAIAEVLQHFYERSVFLSKQWIVAGQEHGVIEETVNPDITAELFVLLSLGLRVRASFPLSSASLAVREVSDFMAGILKKQ